MTPSYTLQSCDNSITEKTEKTEKIEKTEKTEKTKKTGYCELTTVPRLNCNEK
jgi:hypothetical protein